MQLFSEASQSFALAPSLRFGHLPWSTIIFIGLQLPIPRILDYSESNHALCRCVTIRGDWTKNLKGNREKAKDRRAFHIAPAHLFGVQIRYPVMKSYKYNAMLHECMMMQVLERSISHKSEESEPASAPNDEGLFVHARRNAKFRDLRIMADLSSRSW